MSIITNVRAGRLDQRIELQRKTVVQSASGNLVGTWSTLKEVWSRVDAEKSGGERYVQNGVRSPADYTFWVRSDIVIRYSLTTEDRILWKGKLYDIRDIPDQQRRGRLIGIVAGGGLNRG